MTDWINRWETGETGWHRTKTNATLINFFDCLSLKPGDRVFVPLCGKTLDMVFFLSKGIEVVGVELSALAIEAFFQEQQLDYQKQQEGALVAYRAPGIVLYCGDYFELESTHLQGVSAIYDRAALVALPSDLRAKYAAHLCFIIANACRMLLLTWDYPQAQIDGPPFAISEAEVGRLYGRCFEYQQLQCINDIKNEPKFQQAGVEYINKATYCLHKREKNG